MAAPDSQPGPVSATAPTAAAPDGAPASGHTVTVTDAGARGMVRVASADVAIERRRDLPTIDPANYELGRELARGGMGRILEARDLRLDREVAIKQLLDDGGGLASRFEREALVTARLQHPSIVAIYEAGRWPSGEPFYAMKLVHGRSLKEVIGDAPTFDARLALVPHVLAVADAMAYAHEHRIVHRDLKPANVLVGRFGETVVIDWGLAKDLEAAEREATDGPAARSSDASLTRAGSIIGTPNYMAPEQARGEPVDERADVYAIGAMLYHVLGGAAPYRGSDSHGVLARVVDEPPEPLAETARAIAPDLLAIVTRAMARASRDRYPSARELADDLRRFLTGRLVASHRYTRGELVLRFVRQHRALLATVAVAVAVLATIGAYSVHRIVGERDHAQGERTRADRERGTAIARSDELALGHARELAATDPAQALRVLASLSPGSSQWPAARVVAESARSHGVATTATLDRTIEMRSLVVADDGRAFATAGEDGTLMWWDATTLAHHVIGKHDRLAFVHHLDSERLVSSSYDQTVRIWRLDGSQPPIVLPHPAPVRRLAMSRDGRVIVTVADDHQLRVWDVASATITRTIAGQFGATHVELADGARAVFFHDGHRLALIDLATGDVRGEAGHDVASYDVSPDGETVAYIDGDGAVRVWRWRSGARRVLELPSRESIDAIAISPDGAQLIGVGRSLAVHAWTLGDGAYHLLGSARDVHELRSAIWSPDGSVVAVAGPGAIQLWDPKLGSERTFDRPGEDVHVQFARGGEALIALESCGVTMWSTARDERVVARVDGVARQVVPLAGGDLVVGEHGDVRVGTRELALGHDILGRAAVANDHRTLATLAPDGTVRVLDLASGRETALAPAIAVHLRSTPADPSGTWIQRVDGRETWVSSMVRRISRGVRDEEGWVAYLAWSPDGTQLAAWPVSGGELHVWQPATGAHRVFALGAADLEAIAFSPDGRALAAASSDGTIAIVTLATGGVRRLSGHDAPVEDVVFTPDGASVISASVDHSVRRWQLATGDSSKLCVGLQGMTQLALLPGAIAAASEDGTVCIADLAGAPARVLDEHDAEVIALAASPDGRRLATADRLGRLRLWDLASGESRTLDLSQHLAGSLAFSRDGTRVLAAIDDGTVRSWPDDLPADEAALRAWIARALAH